jgi:hypothetical protein
LLDRLKLRICAIAASLPQSHSGPKFGWGSALLAHHLPPHDAVDTNWCRPAPTCHHPSSPAPHAAVFPFASRPAIAACFRIHHPPLAGATRERPTRLNRYSLAAAVAEKRCARNWHSTNHDKLARLAPLSGGQRLDLKPPKQSPRWVYV